MLVNVISRATVQACLNVSGTVTRTISMTGALQTADGSDHLQISITEHYVNCDVMQADGHIVYVTGDLTSVGSFGQTPGARQSLRVTGSGVTLQVLPEGYSYSCNPDLSVNYLNPTDRRSWDTSGLMCQTLVGPVDATTLTPFPPAQPVAAPTTTYSYRVVIVEPAQRNVCSTLSQDVTQTYILAFTFNGNSVSIPDLGIVAALNGLTMTFDFLNEHYTGTFSTDFQTISGTETPIGCTFSGTWSGTRLQ